MIQIYLLSEEQYQVEKPTVKENVQYPPINMLGNKAESMSLYMH